MNQRVDIAFDTSRARALRHSFKLSLINSSLSLYREESKEQEKTFSGISTILLCRPHKM